MSSLLTCITCRVAFVDDDVQREHYKSDWHRYNLKRKVAGLPSVTAENFQERLLSQKAQAAEDEKDNSGHCDLCHKHFATQNAFKNHLNSKKHKEIVALEERKMAEKILEKPEGASSIIDETVAMENAKNIAKNRAPVAVASGSSSHASLVEKKNSNKAELFDEEDYEEDDSDVMSCESWDGEALGLEECLFCSKMSKTLDDNIKHMTKSHSFFIPDIEFLTDLEGFIGYLGEKVGAGNMCLWCNDKGKAFHTLKSVQQHMSDKGHCKLLYEGDSIFEYSDFYDYRSSYPDHQTTAVEPMEEGEEDEEVQQDAIKEENYELVLPSGATIGHRSLMRYYRQNLKPDRQLVKSSSLSKVLSHYRAIGWHSTSGEEVEKRRKDVAHYQRWQHKQHMRLGVKANNILKTFDNRNKVW